MYKIKLNFKKCNVTLIKGTVNVKFCKKFFVHKLVYLSNIN